MAKFDEFANAYDRWFFNNQNLLDSELRLVAHFLQNSGKTLSIGCGSGIFESLLKKDFGIEISHGIEPSIGMAEIARKRGMKVSIATAEEGDFGQSQWDTILFNGTPSYISDLPKAVQKAYKGLKKKGQIILIDVPKESSYGIIYNLAKVLGTWDHPLLEGCQPPDPYPIDLVEVANWRTTEEKINILTESGFSRLEFAQTLTKHPKNSNFEVEEPVEGFQSGDYVAIRAKK